MYIDVHTHLTHEKFAQDWQEVIERAVAAGLNTIVVNGLNPLSNRQTLALAKNYKPIKAALGIYPIDAVNHILPDDFVLNVAKFDVDQEIDFIDQQASNGDIFAIGECGLDGYWLEANTFAEQERVFRRLIQVAKRHELPLIIHTRKMEIRSAEILREEKVKRVNFHCFGGKVKLAKRWAEEDQWWFSIPPNCLHNEAFQRMLDILPAEKILTETDAPYLAPVKGQRNEPRHVVKTVDLLASRRGWSHEQARQQVLDNFHSLFSLGV